MYDEENDLWRLSPAYDLTYSNTYWGEHTTSVDGNGKNPGERQLLNVGVKAGLQKSKCYDIMEEIKVEVFYLTFLKLFFKDFLYLCHVGKIIPRELGSEIEGIPLICFQQFADNQLRLPAMITISGIIIVDSMLHTVSNHLFGSLHIDTAVITAHNR